jgi:putative F0F1-ATPase subunit (Ca2+/Mg2+ transporter)
VGRSRGVRVRVFSVRSLTEAALVMSDDGGSDALRGRDLIGLGGLLVASVVAGLVLGLVLDNVLGTEPVFTLLGIFAGIVLGAVAFWLKVRDALRG